MIKLRVTLPKENINILRRDMEDYEINENRLYNLIYENLDFIFSHEENKSVYKEETGLVQFTLTKENYCKYATPENLKIKKATFFRQLFLQYTAKNPYEREMIIFKENVKKIEEAIEKNRKIEVKFKTREDILDPYFIASLEKENRNYLVSESSYKEMVVSYRIKNIRKVEILEEERENFDKKYVEELKRNFDPFLSYGNRIRIKLTPEGVVHYEKVITNRPKLLEKNGNEWIFEANEYKALLYFSGFMDMVEIIEP
ncbi:MAG: WYL domain-containing protein, partial [Fusobacteriaceae bacterium]